jgi:hypothetical protein
MLHGLLRDLNQGPSMPTWEHRVSHHDKCEHGEKAIRRIGIVHGSRPRAGP